LRDLLDRLHTSLNEFKQRPFYDDDIHLFLDMIQEDWKAARQEYLYWMLIVCILSLAVGIILGRIF
jgi:hypothetical protein